LSDTPTATGPRDPHDRAGRRLVSLDLLRGLTVLGMIVVNATAGVAHRDGPVFPLLLHADWVGFTVADSIFPAFILMVGVSIAISSRGRVPDTGRILIRAARLVLLGLFLSNIFWLFDMQEYHVRLPGVLQRIGIVYAAAALIYPRTGWRMRAALAVVLLLVYWPLCLLPSPDGSSTDLWVQGHNFVSWFDRAVLGGTRFVLGPQGYDPEGLLSTLPTIAEALIGTLAGDFLRRGLPPREASRAIALAGAAMLVAGVGWSFVFPISKNMWSSSFVLVSAGIALLALAGFHLGFDRDDAPVRRGGVLVSFGRNAIAAYALHEMTAFILTSDALQWPYHQLAPVSGTRIAALAPVLIFTGLVWWPIAAMDRRGWYLKI
jgi:predicted acyltransferase